MEKSPGIQIVRNVSQQGLRNEDTVSVLRGFVKLLDSRFTQSKMELSQPSSKAVTQVMGATMEV